MPASFEFDKSVQRYRYTSGDRKGKFVSFAQLEKLTAEYQVQQSKQGQKILDKLTAGDISLNDWMREIAAHLKVAHINMFALGFGGHQRMGAREYGAIGNRLKSEYGYLRNFAVDIGKGALSGAQIKARLNLYYQSIWQTYEGARERSHSLDGFTLERRVTAKGESCLNCAEFEARGWVKIGTLPTPGQASECKSNCRCWKEFASEGKANILSMRSGWIQMQTKQEQEQYIEKSDRRQLEIQGLYWGEPSDEDLEIIQKVTGFEWTSREWYMVPMQASDNFIWSSWKCCWHSSVLVNMARQLPGQSLMRDHAGEVEETKGFFTRSALLQSENAPAAIVESQGHGAMNRQQMAREGYLQLYLQTAIPSSDDGLIESAKKRKHQHVSTGSILNGIEYICPHCSAEHGRDVSFYEVDEKGANVCPHEIPHPFTKWMADNGFIETKNLIFADYAIMNSLKGERHYETSLVYVGNLAGAQLVRPRPKQLTL